MGSSMCIDNRFSGQSKDKVSMSKIFVDLAGSGIDLVRCMQRDGDMENT